MTSDTSYTGLILRTEKAYTAQSSGYLNYYATDGTRASVGSLIYTIDETGRMSEILRQLEQDNSSLSDSAIENMRNHLASFSENYDPNNYSEVYSLDNKLNQTIGSGISSDTLNQLLSDAGENSYNYVSCNSEDAGIISFRYDNYQSLTTDQITSDMFDESTCQSTVLSAGDLIEANTQVCNIITSDEWDVIVPINEADAVELEGSSVVSVTFNDTGLTCNAEYSTFVGADGNIYADLHLYKYMIRYFDQRYVNISLNLTNASGLKIPKTSVVSVNMYTIPTDYLLDITYTDEDGDTSTEQVFRTQTYDDQGNVYTTDVDCSIYAERDGMYLVGTDAFTAGTVLTNADNSSTYTINDTAQVQGVFNINKGYSVFKIIEIIDENDEYYIVADDTSHGISVYDHILLSASVSDDDKLIFD